MTLDAQQRERLLVMDETMARFCHFSLTQTLCILFLLLLMIALLYSLLHDGGDNYRIN
jgi:hypothetical protein